MANISALIWDCDCTLIDGYMQDPLFRKFNVDSIAFWEEVRALPEHYKKDQGVTVNPETIYLSHFIHKARDGVFPGLNNAMLRELGTEQKFSPGVPEIFESTVKMIAEEKRYAEYGIKVEHYVISTGFAETIRGSLLMQYITGLWGCELIEAPDAQGNPLISEIGYTIDNTTKTRALFEINKGIRFTEGADVNAQIPEEQRRVHFKNMIYIADGPSDIPAFSLINKNGGSTFAIYPKGIFRAMQQVERMREDGRINMYAEADYRDGTLASFWIRNKVQMLAERIYQTEKQKQRNAFSSVPRHLT